MKYFTSVVSTQYPADSRVDFKNDDSVSVLAVAYSPFIILEVAIAGELLPFETLVY